jgi:N4-gp56 family major capsid protein
MAIGYPYTDTAGSATGSVNYGATTLSSTLTAAILQIYSKQILFAFQPFCYFDQFTTKRTELGTLPGNTINFLKYNNLTDGADLTENVPMQVESISGSQIQITVAELGKAVSTSEFLQLSSFDDVMSSKAKLLGMHYAKCVDAKVRDALETGVTNVLWGGDATSYATVGAGDEFSTVEIKDAVESLKTLNSPGLMEAGGSYVSIIHPHQARTLRDDNNWINAALYSGSVPIFNGEIGKYEDVRFVETTQAKINASGTNSATVDVYHSYFFGFNLIAHAIALPVEMRDGGVIDFGRMPQPGLVLCGRIQDYPA